MRVILVPVADRPECAHALEAAFRLAARFDANVVGCHIRPHRQSRVNMPGLKSIAAQEWVSAHKGKNPDKLSRDARTLFGQVAEGVDYRVAQRAGVQSRGVGIWQERVGAPANVIPIIGPMSDLLVLSRPGPKGGKLAHLFMMESLLHACRPVLLLPQRRMREPGRNILIGWNQSPEASRAVAAGMPLLERADSVTIAVAGQESAPGPKAKHLLQYLRHHGIDAKVTTSQGKNPARELEVAYREAGADLLLMGAYSRHRLREQIFGGVTDHMLMRTKLPVLVYHSAS
ncbi:MAG: universal stress protein [Gammaproteobacteria bacterium]